MGQALYRKYRSKSLDELVGQEHVTQTLKNALKEGRISHAYLLTGPRGTGKTSIARILAHEINNLPYDGEAHHLDIIEIDAASNNGVEDVRDLREKIMLAPTSAKYKIYIIDEVHMLSNAAFNALLKTLEEPPAHAIFILATTEVHKLPATIISRTQRFQLHLLPKEKVVSHLKHIAKEEGIKVDDDALELIAQHGDGAFRDSISLLDQLRTVAKEGITTSVVEGTLGLAPRKIVEQLLESLQAGHVKEVLQSYEQLLAKGIAAPALAQQLINVIRVFAPAHPKLYKLIDQLIDVPRAYNPRLKMEVVLAHAALEHADDKDQPKKPPTPKASAGGGHKEPVAAKPVKSEPAKAAAPEKIGTIPEPAATVSTADIAPEPAPQEEAQEAVIQNNGPLPELTEERWQEVVAAIKDSGPTLYTVVRQAIPYFDVEQQLLTITFRFPLHQKRFDEARNKQEFGKVLQKMWGSIPEMQVVLNKNAVRHIKPVAANPNAMEEVATEQAATGSVMNLMGGGEVVNI